MKKLLAFIICIILMLGTTACNKSDSKPVDSSSKLSSETDSGTEIELDSNLLRALKGTNDITEIESLKIIHNNNSKVAVITDVKDWEFLKKYVLVDTVSYYEKEKLIASPKTNFLVIGRSESTIYLLNDGRIIKQQMCGDSGVKEEDRNFEIYKAEENYLLNENRLTDLLKKYKSTAVKTDTDETSSNKDKGTSSKKETTTNSDKNSNSKKEPVTQNQTKPIKSRLPQAKHSPKNNDVSLYDVINLSNGGFAGVGYKRTSESFVSIIQIYDESSKLKKEYTYDIGNGFNKIAACSDGGFIVSTQFSSHIIKIDSDFKVVWFKKFHEDSSLGRARDIEEINPNCYAVVFDSSLYSVGTLKISYLDKKGNIIEIIDLVENFDAYDTEIIADGNGGFYLMTICDESLADKYSMVRQNYDKTKSDEVIIMHFAANRRLKWVKTLGGGGNDWIDAATVDDKGNFYIAISTDSPGTDSLWEMKVDMYDPTRSMLLKLNKKGDLIYKTPLSSRGSGSDQVLGIHLRDNKVYVVGKSEYFDGYQNKYYNNQTPTKETYASVFVTYTACFDSKGKELGRDLYRCDSVNSPIDSVMLPNGSIVVAGWASEKDNQFNLKTLAGVERGMVFFVFKAG